MAKSYDLIVPFYCIILFVLVFSTNSVLNQLCSKRPSAQVDNSYLDSLRTGFEFLNDGIPNNLDLNLFLGTDTENANRRENLTSLKLVQMFIRTVKSLPAENLEIEPSILSGTDVDSKPEWCFYPFQLKDLVTVELNIYKILHKFYQNQNDKNGFSYLNSYLMDIEESLFQGLRNFESRIGGSHLQANPHLYIVSHPFLVYRMIRRFSEDLQPILLKLEKHTELINSLKKEANPDQIVFPNSDDLEDALEAIARTQEENNLDTYEIGRGLLVNVDTGINLNALQSLEIGAYYLEKKYYDYSIQWFHFAIKTFERSLIINSYPGILAFFEEMLHLAVEKHNEVFDKKKVTFWNPGVFTKPVQIPFEPELYVRRMHELNILANEKRNITKWNWAFKANFKRLCSGENLQTNAEKAILKCWYDTSRNRYWLINPLKIEQLSVYPPVYQIYDFIGNSLMEKMKNIAIPELDRSKVVDSTSPEKSKIGKDRTSSQVWLSEQDEDTSFLAKLTIKLELMSGLKIKPSLASVAYQVASYGSSHHYNLHIDSVRKFTDPRRAVKKGNRITTIMGYLSDVAVGGRTAFPVLGISAEPIKGSIVMWNNLKRNGEDRDERSWHGGCPVVLGIKWITNKWIYYKENIFTFQCSKDPNE